MEPLLTGGSGGGGALTPGGGGERSPSPVAVAAAGAARALGLYAAQLALVLAYTVAAFVLPNEVGFMSEAAHIAALHALLFVATAVLSGSLRYLHTGEAARSPLAASDLFPLTPLLAEAPVIIVTFANALLLPVLGLEAWLRQEIGPNFSVLLMVQILAVAEAAAVGAGGGALGWRYIQFRKVLAHSHADAFAVGHTSGSNKAVNLSMVRGMGAGGRGRVDSMSAAVAGLTTPYGPAGGGGGGAYTGGRDRVRSRGASLSAGHGHGGISRDPSLAAMMPFQTPAKRAPHGGDDGGGDRDEEAGVGDSPALGDGAGAAGGASPGPGAHFVSGAAYARALERIGALGARERELEGRVAALTASLDALHAGGGGGDLASLLRSTTEELLELQEAHRGLGARCDGLEDTIAKYEAELRRAAGDVARLRLLLKEERKRADKLASAVEVGKEANARAQAAIVELNARLSAVSAASSASGGGVGNGGGGSSGLVTADSAAAAAAAASAAGGGPGGARDGAASYQARLARTVSRQQSFNVAAAAAAHGGSSQPIAIRGGTGGGAGGAAAAAAPYSQSYSDSIPVGSLRQHLQPPPQPPGPGGR